MCVHAGISRKIGPKDGDKDGCAALPRAFSRPTRAPGRWDVPGIFFAFFSRAAWLFFTDGGIPMSSPTRKRAKVENGSSDSSLFPVPFRVESACPTDRDSTTKLIGTHDGTFHCDV